MTTSRLSGYASYQAVATGATKVSTVIQAKYGDKAPDVATSIVARTGAGTVTLIDTHGKTTDALAIDATGATAPREISFLYVEIVAMGGGLTAVEIYA